MSVIGTTVGVHTGAAYCCRVVAAVNVTLSIDWAWTVALSGWLQSTAVVMKKVFCQAPNLMQLSIAFLVSKPLPI